MKTKDERGHIHNLEYVKTSTLVNIQGFDVRCVKCNKIYARINYTESITFGKCDDCKEIDLRIKK